MTAGGVLMYYFALPITPLRLNWAACNCQFVSATVSANHLKCIASKGVAQTMSCFNCLQTYSASFSANGRRFVLSGVEGMVREPGLCGK